MHLEYADTTCEFYKAQPEFGCAYTSSVYTDGYHYRDRTIGHAIDGDSQQFALGAMLVNGDGSSWELAAQTARVNRGSVNPVHSVAPFATEIRSADVYYRRILLGGDLRLGVGFEDRHQIGSADDGGELRGFLQWANRFD